MWNDCDGKKWLEQREMEVIELGRVSTWNWFNCWLKLKGFIFGLCERSCQTIMDMSSISGGCEWIPNAVHRTRHIHHEERARKQQQQKRPTCLTSWRDEHRRNDAGYRSVCHSNAEFQLDLSQACIVRVF